MADDETEINAGDSSDAGDAADAPKTPSKPKPRGSRSAPPRTRADSKQAQLIAMLRRHREATIDEIAEALAWQPHTVRGAIAGALKKKLGLEITSEKDLKRGRVYRLVASQELC